jgi:hypothetical protein
MKLNAAEQKLLIKILENTIERFEPDDLIHMIKGPKYKIVLDELYTQCFRPHIKYGAGLLDQTKELTDLESEIIQAIWDKISNYLSEELGDL